MTIHKCLNFIAKSSIQPFHSFDATQNWALKTYMEKINTYFIRIMNVGIKRYLMMCRFNNFDMPNILNLLLPKRRFQVSSQITNCLFSGSYRDESQYFKVNLQIVAFLWPQPRSAWQAQPGRVRVHPNEQPFLLIMLQAWWSRLHLCRCYRGCVAVWVWLTT